MSQPWSQRQRLLASVMGLTASSSGRSGLAATRLLVAVGGRQPEAVAAPGIEAAVVAGLLDRVEDVAVLDDMAAPAAVADVDAGARHVVDGAMADGDGLAMEICTGAVCFSTRPVR